MKYAVFEGKKGRGCRWGEG